MNTLALVIYVILGLLIGYLIPDISLKIMEYKKGKENIKKSEGFLFSKLCKICFCLFNGVIWASTGLHINSVFVALLISIQITLAFIIAFIDINIRIIPNELVLTIIILGIIFQTINYGLYGIIGSIMSMIFIMIVFTAIAGFMGFGKVGAGDVKLAGAIGLALGYPLIITAMGTMAIVLLVCILAGLALKKIQLSTM
ncbi:MAG: Type leader peptidase family, partial [Clostridiaceae bacterium]|nr:Type leader peptidase family [Clostridiaceae bacterium]